MPSLGAIVQLQYAMFARQHIIFLSLGRFCSHQSKRHETCLSLLYIEVWRWRHDAHIRQRRITPCTPASTSVARPSYQHCSIIKILVPACTQAWTQSYTCMHFASQSDCAFGRNHARVPGAAALRGPLISADYQARASSRSACPAPSSGLCKRC